MPELPEVETIKLGLQKYLVGHRIEEVEIKKPKLFQGDKKNIIGAKITKIDRFGKGLVIELSNGYCLAIHIKLTGQLIFRNQELGIKNQAGRVEVPNNWTHLIFHLDGKSSRAKSRDNFNHNGATLFYNDLRQFGWIKVVKKDEIKNLSFFKELGPEFMKDLDVEKFSQILSKAKTSIKPLLMDQQKMAGVGNIYANDALYLAKIDPRRPANSLSSIEVKKLYDAVLTVLKKGLEEGGASELTFVNVLGEKGNYQNHSLIYGHNGEKCKRDGAIIKKITLAGRGTYLCPTCQK